MTNLSVFS